MLLHLDTRGILESLYAMTRKATPIEWTDDCQQAYVALVGASLLQLSDREVCITWIAELLSVSLSHSSHLIRPLWHGQFGQLSGQELHKVSQDKLVHGLNGTLSDKINFYETCMNRKQKRAPFRSRCGKSTKP